MINNERQVAGLLEQIDMARMYKSRKGKSGSSKPYVTQASRMV